MFIEPTITWVPSGFSGYIWLETKIVFEEEIGFQASTNIKKLTDFIEVDPSNVCFSRKKHGAVILSIDNKILDNALAVVIDQVGELNEVRHGAVIRSTKDDAGRMRRCV